MTPQKPAPDAGLFRKSFWILRHRPAHVLAQLRTYATFWLQHQLWRIWPTPGVELAINVRLQRRGCLMAEAPGARIVIGKHSLVFENAHLEALGQGRIEIGPDSSLGDVRIYARGSIRIGEGFLGAWGLFMQDYESHPIDSDLRGLQSRIACRGFHPSWSAPEDRQLPVLSWEPKPGYIEIGSHVWIGANCAVLKNVRIGDGCVVASGSVLTAGDYPAHSLIAGNPAKVVKSLRPDASP
jgi:acetyltransferase-like isoleucine patch superfamily enzyme